MAVFVLDADRSLATLGGPEQVAHLFGVPPLPVTDGYTMIRQAFGRLFQRGVKKTEHPLLGVIEEPAIVMNEAGQRLGIQGLVIDTFSHATTQEMRSIAGRNEKTGQQNPMELQHWGTLLTRADVLLSIIKDLPCWVIVNVHQEYDKDETTGQKSFFPRIGGATKHTIRDFFDVVLFTMVQPAGISRKYLWQVAPTPQRLAKDRLSVLGDGPLEQDFAAIITAYAQAGISNPKILVIGESGTGKTRALGTLPKIWTGAAKAA